MGCFGINLGFDFMMRKKTWVLRRHLLVKSTLRRKGKHSLNTEETQSDESEVDLGLTRQLATPPSRLCLYVTSF